MRNVLIALLVSILLAGCAAQPAPIKHIYAFGDGLTDNGNLMRGVREDIAEGGDPALLEFLEAYVPQDRFSNGPVTVEVLAENLQAELTDYAVFGALSSDASFSGTAKEHTGVLGQIDQFEAELQGQKADPAALFFIFISGGDFYNAFCYNDTPTPPADLADQAITNISTAVTRLAELGAKRFMVVNSKNLPIEPQIDYCNGGDQAPAFKDQINSKLPGKMEALAKQMKVDIEIFDYSAITDQIYNNPDQYGFTNVTDSCIVYLDREGYEPASICAAPDEYVFWDRHHTTSHVNQIIGEAMAEQLSK